jgi:uncharacterized protein (DUF302 family)
MGELFMRLMTCLRQGAIMLMLCVAALPVAATQQFLSGFVDGVIPGTVDEAVTQVTEVLTQHNCVVERIIDHGANAREAGLSLNDTKLILFSDHAVDDKLIRRSQIAALDLPQKLLVRMDATGHVRVTSKPGTVVFNRYKLKIFDRTLRLMSRRTEQFTADLGLITRRSANDFATTRTNLQAAISANLSFKLAGAPLDYTSTAMLPTVLFIAGAPTAGTRLMQQRAAIGLDLPLKILVWEDREGNVNLSYNDPYYLARYYDIENPDIDTLLARMAATLDGFMVAAGAVNE